MNSASTLLPIFQKNEVLFGHDGTPEIVAVEITAQGAVQISARDGARIFSEPMPFHPFILLTGDEALAGWPGDAQIEILAGESPFNRLAQFRNLRELDEARWFLQKTTGKTPSSSDAPYWYFNDPLHQYLLRSGKTHFLEMTFGDLRRLQLTIQTYCADGFTYSNSARSSDRIVTIGLSDSTGWERIISGTECDEAEMLRQFVDEIRRRDPDVIEGHNLLRFDLEYLEARARRHKMALNLGRDGSRLSGHASRMQLADRTIAYRKYSVFGRHLIDTWIIAQHYDIATRELASLDLEELARYFGIAGEPTWVPPDRISWCFDHDADALHRCAVNHVRATRAISETLSPSHFVQAQIFPYSYQEIPLRGNATKIDTLFVREYLHQHHSIPYADEGHEVLGGFTEMQFQGTAHRVLHCDVTSLYPSIMLVYHYLPKKDDLGVFPGLLRDLLSFRVKAKELARAASDDETRVYFNALQSTFKILINSFYGYLGFQMGHFNDFAAANNVTAKGRELIQAAIAWLIQNNAKVIEVDTDGIYFVPPESIRSEADEERLIAALAATLPTGIDLELDGRYSAMFSYKMKNYALLDEQGRLRIKGSGLRSRGLELFQREWLEQMLLLLLQDEREKIRALYGRFSEDIERHRRNIFWLAKTETLQDSLETYQIKIKTKKRNPAAPYELALKAQRPYRPGDQISYYVTGTKAKIKVNENCKLVAHWDAQKPDENVEYYKAKLKDLYEKFKPWVGDGSETEPHPPRSVGPTQFSLLGEGSSE
jgi:DNA polymerase, archaea type